MEQYDILIIGAGTAGLSAAKEALKHTDKVAIIEGGAKGTTCARVGCMPSKALIEAANAYHTRKKFNNFGIRGAERLSINIPDVLKRVRSLRDHFVEGVVDDMQNYNVIEGMAKFVEPNVIEVNGDNYKADAIIVCTGSHPRVIEELQPFRDDILTTDNFFEQRDLPESLAVIGLGSVGVELGQASARLGVDVTGFNRSSNISGIQDPKINNIAIEILGEEMSLNLDATIDKVEKIDTGYKIISGGNAVEVSSILASAGRIPNVDGLGLKDIAVPFDNKMPLFDKDTLQIKDMPIYIAGDANAYRAIQHEAADEGKIAVRNALGISTKNGRREKLSITFTDPPIAQVGQSYNAIKDTNPIVGEVSYSNQGRAVVAQQNKGQANIYAAQDGKLLGAEMMAPSADHFAHLFALAVQEELTIQSLLDLPYYHPALEEGLRTALIRIEKQRKKGG